MTASCNSLIASSTLCNITNLVVDLQSTKILFKPQLSETNRLVLKPFKRTWSCLLLCCCLYPYRRVPKLATPPPPESNSYLKVININFQTFIAILESNGPPKSNGLIKSTIMRSPCGGGDGLVFYCTRMPKN